jgi:hypothetical protein
MIALELCVQIKNKSVRTRLFNINIVDLTTSHPVVLEIKKGSTYTNAALSSNSPVNLFTVLEAVNNVIYLRYICKKKIKTPIDHDGLIDTDCLVCVLNKLFINDFSMQ